MARSIFEQRGNVVWKVGGSLGCCLEKQQNGTRRNKRPSNDVESTDSACGRKLNLQAIYGFDPTVLGGTTTRYCNESSKSRSVSSRKHK